MTITRDEIHKLALQFEQEQNTKAIVLVNQPITRNMEITYTPEFVEHLYNYNITRLRDCIKVLLHKPTNVDFNEWERIHDMIKEIKNEPNI